jgi:hypothetical protein
MKALVIFIGLTFGNFVAQWIKAEPLYVVAIERSYFEGCALLSYWFMDKFFWKDSKW